MNSIERVMATVQGKSVDRRAVAPLLSLYGSEMDDCPTQTYYSDSDAYIRGQCAVYETFTPDIIFGPFCFAREGLPFGSAVEYYPHMPPNLKKPGILDADDLESFGAEELLHHPVVTYIEKSISGLIARLGDKVPVAPIMLSPIDMPVMMLGMEKWLHTFLFEIRKTRQILDLTIPYFIQRCNRLFDMGAPFIVVSGIFVNPGVLTRDMVELSALPFIHNAFSQLQGPVILHSGGKKMVPFLDLLNKVPQVAGFVVSSGEDMRPARTRAGSAPVLAGNIDGPAMHQVSSQHIYTQSLALLNELEGDSRCILGTSGADIRKETPAANIQALLRAAQDHGGNCESSS